MTFFAQLLNNIALLLALSLLYSFIVHRWNITTTKGQIISGVLFGSVACAGMLMTLRYSPGVVFDGRSIIISIAGLIGGPVTAAIAAAIAGVYRTYMGGGGVYMGLGVIATSALIGCGGHYLRRRGYDPLRPLPLFIFGFIVHISMICWMMALPSHIRWNVIRQISLPVMTIFPFATLLLGTLLKDQEAKTRFERELGESEAKYHALVENAQELIFVARDYTFLYVNRFVSRLTGFSATDLMGRSILEWIADEDKDRVREVHQQILEGDSATRSGEYLVESAQGKRWLLVNSVRIVWEGAPAVLNFATDITEQKTTQEALRRNEEQFRSLVETTSDWVWKTDQHRAFTYVTPKVQAALGYTPEDILGETSFYLMTSEESERLQGFIESRRPFSEIEQTIRHKDGRLVNVETSGAPLFDGNGVYQGYIGFSRDVTEQKRAREEMVRLESRLRQAQKMEAIGTLAGGIAHDFNNILTVLIGFGSLLQAKTTDEDPRKPYIRQILASAERAADLTRSLLAFSRKQQVDLKLLKVNDIITGGAKILRRLLTEDINLEMELCEENPAILADATQMDQILMNLATNARDAMPMGGTLCIKTKTVMLDNDSIAKHVCAVPGKYVLITASDTGVGIEEAAMEHIFEPFFTTKGVGKGTGLGLSSVYGIVKRHDGYIAVESKPGTGTTFHIYFPLTEKEEMEEAPSTADVKGGNETILVAEDDMSVRDLITEVLEEAGYHTIAAGDGEEAISLFAEHKDHIKLIILDVVMPKKSGREVLDEVIRQKPDTNTLFISGYTGDVILDRGIDGDGQRIDFVMKPLLPDELLAKVRHILDRQSGTPGTPPEETQPGNGRQPSSL